MPKNFKTLPKFFENALNKFFSHETVDLGNVPINFYQKLEYAQNEFGKQEEFIKKAAFELFQNARQADLDSLKSFIKWTKISDVPKDLKKVFEDAKKKDSNDKNATESFLKQKSVTSTIEACKENVSKANFQILELLTLTALDNIGKKNNDDLKQAYIKEGLIFDEEEFEKLKEQEALTNKKAYIKDYLNQRKKEALERLDQLSQQMLESKDFIQSLEIDFDVNDPGAVSENFSQIIEQYAKHATKQDVTKEFDKEFARAEKILQYNRLENAAYQTHELSKPQNNEAITLSKHIDDVPQFGGNSDRQERYFIVPGVEPPIVIKYSAGTYSINNDYLDETSMGKKLASGFRALKGLFDPPQEKSIGNIFKEKGLTRAQIAGLWIAELEKNLVGRGKTPQPLVLGGNQEYLVGFAQGLQGAKLPLQAGLEQQLTQAVPNHEASVTTCQEAFSRIKETKKDMLKREVELAKKTSKEQPMIAAKAKVESELKALYELKEQIENGIKTPKGERTATSLKREDFNEDPGMKELKLRAKYVESRVDFILEKSKNKELHQDSFNFYLDNLQQKTDKLGAKIEELKKGFNELCKVDDQLAKSLQPKEKSDLNKFIEDEQNRLNKINKIIEAAYKLEKVEKKKDEEVPKNNNPSQIL